MCGKRPIFVAPLDPMPPIPLGTEHPGSFGIERHQHVHTGVDLYAPYGCPVRAMEKGRVVKIDWFTGPSINMPWWNDTRAVYIEGAHGVFNYGEIQEYPNLKVRDTIKQGECFGYVVTVLKKYKGRPMSMLHVELYDHGYTDTWGEWKIGASQPEHLKDPTPHLLMIGKPATLDPYTDSNAEFLKITHKCSIETLVDNDSFFSCKVCHKTFTPEDILGD
jgi:murein DD-endopeptidase MepM/ murein hydrolase activator NlpD